MVQGSGNVLPLNEHVRARARLTREESAGVLRDCRDLALDRMATALSGMLDRVEDDLFELAEKTPDRETQNVYLDARSQARSKREQMEAAFRRHFVEFFNRKVRGEDGSVANPQGELSLLGDEELEGALAVEEMARKLTGRCEGELFALSQRFGFLLQRPGLKDEANPIAPTTVCSALKDACDQVEAGFKVRMMLLRSIEQYVAADLVSAYHDVNAHLVRRQILPEVRATAQPLQRPARPTPQPAPGVNAKVPDADVFKALAHFLMAQPGGDGSGTGLPAGGGAAPAAAAIPASGTSFMAELTRRHRHDPAGATAGGAPVNVLRDLKDAPEGATLSALDAMTIDIVAMLFDYVFEDQRIPGNVKGLLGRLQIPTLKVALLDKGFFSSKTHPARRLIDALAEAAMGLDEDSRKGEATVAMIDRAVHRVLSEFETDIGLFFELLAETEAFLEEQHRAETYIVERSARFIEQREREEIANLIAEDEITRRMQLRPWVPAAVRTMLLQHWVRALARIYLAEGEGSPAWNRHLLTLEELLWSVEPKADSDDRKRLVTSLPELLKNLQGGLLRAELQAPEREAFLGELVDCHAAAVKAGLRGLAIVPDAPEPVAESAGPPAIQRSMLPAGDVQVEEIRLRAPRGQGPLRNVFTRTGIWTNLSRGTWVEFRRENGEALRCRLTWISPAKGVYLFTNPNEASNALSISPEALAEQMRLGEARILDAAPLVDRAVDSMLENLRASM